LGPSAVDDFTLGVLFVAERDDRGFAPTRVRTEFRVDVSLDNLGDGLGLRRVKREREEDYSSVFVVFREREGAAQISAVATKRYILLLFIFFCLGLVFLFFLSFVFFEKREEEEEITLRTKKKERRWICFFSTRKISPTRFEENQR